MKWKSLGKIFEADGQYSWMATHAAVPYAYHIENNQFKIFFSTRDNLNRSHVGYVIIDVTSPHQLLEISSEPLLKPGAPGTFDDSGAMLSWIQSKAGRDYVYYIGWNQSTTVPFRNALGLGLLQDDQIKKLFCGPILDRSPTDPCFVASAAVIEEDNAYRMWYVSGTQWKPHKKNLRHYYHIKHATSSDAIHWQPDGHVCIDFKEKNEYAISRPSVLKHKDGYQMWYSYRGPAYKVGYAKSTDGLAWDRRDDECDLSQEASDWDNKMQAYPHVFQHQEQTYMLYNGNGYGQTGFGLAILEAP